jgi:hypothetical protein
MQTAEVRIECIKLAHRHDLSADEVIARATAFANWITGGSDAPTTLTGPDDAPKVEKNTVPANNRISPSPGAKR